MTAGRTHEKCSVHSESSPLLLTELPRPPAAALPAALPAALQSTSLLLEQACWGSISPQRPLAKRLLGHGDPDSSHPSFPGGGTTFRAVSELGRPSQPSALEDTVLLGVPAFLTALLFLFFSSSLLFILISILLYLHRICYNQICSLRKPGSRRLLSPPAQLSSGSWELHLYPVV